jgi:hypothetical protein
MRILTLAGTLLAVGCAGNPPLSAAPPPPSPHVAAPSGVGAVPAAETADAQRLADARKLGYKIVDQDGVQYFCQKDLQTGSHLRRETICLTPDQMDAVRSQTQQNLQNLMRQTPPPQGH